MIRFLLFLYVSTLASVSTHAQGLGNPIPAASASIPVVASMETPALLGLPLADITIENDYWGPGGYISITKLFAYIILFFFWVGTTSWANCDAERRKDPDFAKWNMILFFSYVLPNPILFTLIPVFFVGFPITLLSWFVPLIFYISHRNKGLNPHEKVMTPAHWKYLFAVLMSKFGVKVKLKKPMKYEEGPPIEMEPTGRMVSADDLKGRLILSRNHPGYNEFRNMIFQALNRKTDAVMFEYTATEMIPRHQIDGVWHDLPPIPREIADPILESAKLLVGANPAEHLARQFGTFSAVIRKKSRYDTEFTVQGTPTGERAFFHFIIKKIPFDTLEQLGMRAELRDKVKGLVNAKKGMVVFSAPPANGLKSMMNIVARTADRFTRDFATVEDEMNPYQEIENVTLTRYNSARGETPMNALGDVFFREPQVVLIRDLVNKDTLEYCCREIEENGRLIITTIRARDGAEALLRLMAMQIEPKLFASTISAVVAGRLIRKLCPECKEAYQPPPQLVQRLGIPPGKVAEFFRVRSAPQEDEKRLPCPNCADIGYSGRTSLFEILEVNDEIRQILVSSPNLELIRQAALKSGQKGFFLEGAVLVAKGITSVEELSRVMKM